MRLSKVFNKREAMVPSEYDSRIVLTELTFIFKKISEGYTSNSLCARSIHVD